VATAVSNLPPRQREVLVLHTYEQLNDEQIARMLDISPQNVRTTLHLARQRLRTMLQRFLD
jgi:RNA polymerase sigma factor (sigma-70 family)